MGPGQKPGGCVPNAVNVFYKDLLTVDGEFLTTSELRSKFDEIGLDTLGEKTTIAMCDTGITA
jgi:3-mercaptopyruvate sulfurtransferase SseA